MHDALASGTTAMKAKHRGHTIDVHRERCLGGWSQLYFSVFRDSDGYECLSSFEDSAETVRDKVKQLKERIDAELKETYPWGDRPALRRFRNAIGYP